MLNVMLSLLNDVIYLQVTIDDQVLSSFIDERDGEIYRIVVIGKDTWMAQNLRFDMPGAIEGLGYSTAFWSSILDGIEQARFMFDEEKFINKWPDTNDDSGASLSCRCVKGLRFLNSK